MKLAFASLCALLTLQSFATVRLVPSQYPTIQSALNSAQPGDTVLVAPGVYSENLVWPNTNNLLLAGTDNKKPSAIINGHRAGRVISATPANTKSFRLSLSGLVLENGFLQVAAHTGGRGAGLYATGAAVNITDCWFTKNTITTEAPIQNAGGGAGLHIESSPTGLVSTISHCRFDYDSVTEVTNGSGTAIDLDNAPANITNTTISHNSMSIDDVATGTVYTYASALSLNAVVIENNTISATGNILPGSADIKGGAVFSAYSNLSLTNVLVDNNMVTPANTGLLVLGSGVYFYGEGQSLQVVNSTLAANLRTDGAPVNGTALYFSSLAGSNSGVYNSILWNRDNGPEIDNQSSRLAAGWSDIRDSYIGTALLHTDPQFLLPADFHLSLSSPCLGAGNNHHAPADALDGAVRPSPAGTRVDMGCYEITQPLLLLSSAGKGALRVIPNPSAGAFRLIVPKEWIGSAATIATGSGDIVYRGKINAETTSYQLHNLHGGVYTLTLSNPLQQAISTTLVIDK